MKRISYFVTMLFLWVFVACGSSDLPIQQNVLPRQLIFFGEDVSGTFSQHERLHPDELYRLCYSIINDGMEAVIYLGSIGNPNVKPFLKCALKPVQKVNPNAPLIQRQEQAIKRKLDIAANKKAVEDFVQQYVTQIYQRKPEMNTDIDGFFQRVQQIFNEPQYKGFQKILCVSSDGFHDLNGQKTLSPLDADRFEGIAFHVSGLKNKDLVKNLNIIFYESSRAFVDNYLYTLKSNQHE